MTDQLSPEEKAELQRVVAQGAPVEAPEYNQERGESYADGGVQGSGRVFYPQPERIAKMHKEWADG